MSMSDEKDIRLESRNSGKSAKRVRFSDEIEIHEFEECKDNRESYIVMESDERIDSSSQYDNNSDIVAVMVEEPISNNNYSENEIQDVDCGKRICNNSSVIIEEITCTEPCLDTIDDNNKCIISHISCEESKNELQNDTIVDSEQEMTDLTDLITKTNRMSISQESCVQSQIISIEEDADSSNSFPEIFDSNGPSCENTPLHSQNEALMSDKLNEIEVTDICQKRYHSDIMSGKQSSRLNSLLNQDKTTFSSADELKSAVFHAWHRIKKEKCFQNSVSPVTPEKETVKKYLHRFVEPRKRVKIISKKYNDKKFEEGFTPPETKKSKSDTEENIIAYKAWKKQKDELLKQQINEKSRKEEQKKSNSVIAEKVQQKNAESAYSAWLSHKSSVMKTSKRRKEWLLHKEAEKMHQRMKRNEEASKAYYEWLERKCDSERNDKNFLMHNQPWIPPG